MITKLLLISFFSWLVLLGSANASLMFDFTGGPTPAGGVDSLDFTADGVMLTVTAFTQNGAQRKVTQNNNAGLGVFTPTAPADSDQLDSVGPNEELHFSISGLPDGVGLRLDEFLFGAYNLSNDDRDNFRFWVDGNEITSGAFKPQTNPWVVGDDFDGVVAFSEFYFRSVASEGQESLFRVKGLDASAAAPEPSTVLLLVSGVGILGLVRWLGGRNHAEPAP